MSGVVVVGGGPAGVLLTYLLARGGAQVTLLESRRDFARRFRGDTLAPGVLEYLDSLGLAEPLLAEVPYTRSDAFRWHTATRTWTLVDYRGASARSPSTHSSRKPSSCRGSPTGPARTGRRC